MRLTTAKRGCAINRVTWVSFLHSKLATQQACFGRCCVIWAAKWFTAALARLKQTSTWGKGMDEGLKAHALDAMIILVQVGTRNMWRARASEDAGGYLSLVILSFGWKCWYQEWCLQQVHVYGPVGDQRIDPVLQGELCALIVDLSVKGRLQ